MVAIDIDKADQLGSTRQEVIDRVQWLVDEWLHPTEVIDFGDGQLHRVEVAR